MTTENRVNAHDSTQIFYGAKHQERKDSIMKTLIARARKTTTTTTTTTTTMTTYPAKGLSLDMDKKAFDLWLKKYALDTYFEGVSKVCNSIHFLQVFELGHKYIDSTGKECSKDADTIKKALLDPDYGYELVFGVSEFREFLEGLRFNPIKIKNDSTDKGKKLKAEIRIANSDMTAILRGKQVPKIALNTLLLYGDGVKTVENFGNGFEAYLQEKAGYFTGYSGYKVNNTPFFKAPDVVNSTEKIQAKVNRCSLAYFTTLQQLQPLPSLAVTLCEKFGYLL